MREHLDFYSVEELTEIVARNMRKLKVESDEDAAGEIALRSRGTPRLANNRLRWVRDYALSRADGRVSLAVARDGLDMLGIDRLGLDPQDRKYLETIARVFGGGPVGVEAVAPHVESCPRHAGRRGRALLAPQRACRPHASRPAADARRIRSSGDPAAGRCGPFRAAEDVLICRLRQYSDSRTIRFDRSSLTTEANYACNLEQLAPALANDGPNPEYPWPQNAAEIRASDI